MNKSVRHSQGKRYRSIAKIVKEAAKRNKAPEPVSPARGTFLDYVIDMYELPDQIELRQVYNGKRGFQRDMSNIRSYFKRAEASVLPKR
jgi:hypothetical protein